MQADRFTIKTQEALQAALTLAARQRHAQVTPLHLLSALLNQEGGVVAPVLGKIGVAPDALRADVSAALDELPTLSSESEPTMSAELLGTLRGAEREMRELKDEYVSVEHLLLALAGAKDATTAARALRGADATRERLLQALADVRGSHRVTDQSPEEKIQALERYGRDLTQAAREGDLDPVIGRDDEIRRLIQVLSRRTKNNPVLIGEPGVARPRSSRGWRNGSSPATSHSVARPPGDRAGHRRDPRWLEVPR